ncbi:MAG: hypothetical protein WBB45_10485 [Cyclobacteriaceae bacterium]
MKYILVLLLSLLVLGSAFGQGREESDVWKYGIHFSNWQQDGGGGISISSPFYKGMSIRVKGQVMIHEYLDDNSGQTSLASFAASTAGLAFNIGRIGETVRIYGEGGPVVVLPSPEFSTDNLSFGGYLVMGSEYIASRSRTYLSYFIETGYVGTLARADLDRHSRYYATGFMLNAGIRLHP